MEDVQNIMNEMENLNEEMAATTDEPVVITEAAVTPLSVEDDPTVELGRTCCVVSLPEGFTVPSPITTANLRIGYNLTKLKCFVRNTTVTATTDCGATFPVSGWEVRIVGCIPYIANLRPITGGSGVCIPASPAELSLCCINNLCVDRCIALFDNQPAAQALCTTISPLLTNCNNITATTLSATAFNLCEFPAPTSPTRGVRFTVVFSITY